MSTVQRTWKVNGKSVAVRAPAGRRRPTRRRPRPPLGVLGNRSRLGRRCLGRGGSRPQKITLTAGATAPLVGRSPMKKLALGLVVLMGGAGCVVQSLNP